MRPREYPRPGPYEIDFEKVEACSSMAVLASSNLDSPHSYGFNTASAFGA
jgi:hypothetical protein